MNTNLWMVVIENLNLTLMEVACCMLHALVWLKWKSSQVFREKDAWEMAPNHFSNFEGTYKNLRLPAAIIAGCSVLGALVLSFLLILQHLQSYNNPAVSSFSRAHLINQVFIYSFFASTVTWGVDEFCGVCSLKYYSMKSVFQKNKKCSAYRYHFC